MTYAGVVLGGGLCVAALVVSAVLTWGAIAYAHRRGLVDQPGFRRAHQVPTPRGGGIGLVVGALVVSAIALPVGFAAYVVTVLCLAGAAVAGIGWLDDHHGLPAWPRLVVQLVASAVFALWVINAAQLAWWWLPVWVLVAVWSINLHNFMDGIDAILGLQVAFVGIGLGGLAWYGMQPALIVVAWAMAAAAAGFLFFNWPPARIFMGDVGSGFAGFMIFALAALLVSRVRLALWPVLILCSTFVVDAGWTLVWRAWRGKRWYSAHHEHVYQWLVRSGWSHARTCAFYALWNGIIVAPVVVWASVRPHIGLGLCIGLYAAETGMWWWVRSTCLTRVRGKGKGYVA